MFFSFTIFIQDDHCVHTFSASHCDPLLTLGSKIQYPFNYFPLTKRSNIFKHIKKLRKTQVKGESNNIYFQISSKVDFTNLKCTSFDPEFNEFEYCHLKSVNRSFKYLSLKVKLHKIPVTKVKVYMPNK